MPVPPALWDRRLFLHLAQPHTSELPVSLAYRPRAERASLARGQIPSEVILAW